jgi:hypothetical protein
MINVNILCSYKDMIYYQFNICSIIKKRAKSEGGWVVSQLFPARVAQAQA